MSSPIAAGGLVLEIVGAVALASSLVFSGQKKRLAQGAPAGWGDPPKWPLDIAIAEQTADAVVGLILLVLGFVAQFDQALDWSPSWATLPWTLGVAAGTAICALPLLFVLRRWFVRRALYARLDESARRDEGRMTQMADSPRQFDQTALTFGILGIAKAKERRVVGKVPADLGASFIGKRRWQRLANERRLAPMVNKPFYGHEGWTLDEEGPGGVLNT